ncbi:MAG: sigma-70 family RNA polymerase sigma factor [Polyangiaceae bacterium]|nr:sigma-70 family RNA polymerase sigma factor [Polyangiaceae bacterium]
MPLAAQPEPRPAPALGFEEIYESYFEFVWRSLRRMGVPERLVDDVAHDVFLVVHRRLPEFENRSSVRTWLFGIAWRVASLHRAREKRHSLPDAVVDDTPDSEHRRPDAEAMRHQAKELVQQLLDELDPARRAILVAVEIEELSVPEAAEALVVPLNTAYSRLRLARRDFEQALRRMAANRRVRHP